LSGREVALEAGALGDDGFAGGQIAGVALAEPAAAQAHVLILGHRPLRARATEQLLIAERLERRQQRALDPPAVLDEPRAVAGVVDVQPQIEAHARATAG